ncbi:Protein trichome birefringence-like 19 [Capsicum annuum]|nr:Protein trichome birefringence-like 19 [Capsicum annuum]
MKDLKKTKLCLDFQIGHLTNNIFVHQSVYTEKVLKRFYVDGAHPLSTLMVVRSLDVNKDPFRPQKKNEELHGPKISYLSAIGAVYPIDASISPDENFKRWKYVDYNFTLATYWSPFLIKMKEANADGPTNTGLFNLYLDEADEKWANQIEEFDYVIFNGGHWFSRCSVYYENNQLVGCRYCGLPNVTDLPSAYGYQRAIRTVLRTINNSENFKGMIFLRTFAPSHFEGGEWNNGGNCVRRRPFTNNETSLEGLNLELYTIQVEEFKAAENEGKKKGKRFRLLDTTQAMLLRPDGHPSKYGHWQNENVVLYNDCVHWCLPGPIDSWSDFLLHMLKFEGRGSHEEKPQFMNQ